MPLLDVVKTDLKTVSKAHTLQTFATAQMCYTPALLLHAFWDRSFKHLWVWCVLNVTNCYVSHLVPWTHVLTCIHILMTVKKKTFFEGWLRDEKHKCILMIENGFDEKYMFTSTLMGAEGSKQQ